MEGKHGAIKTYRLLKRMDKEQKAIERIELASEMSIQHYGRPLVCAYSGGSDLIIDCFAGGGGASVGIEMALGRKVDIAINHDPDAILMHKTNHPDTLHLTEDIFKVDLQKYVKGQHVALMWASPDCTSHSKAKGGKPREKGLRILPWAVYKHAKEILPDVIIMENVEEIQQWGPLDKDGYPIKERKGESYKKFISAMKSLGYIFDSKESVAAVSKEGDTVV